MARGKWREGTQREWTVWQSNDGVFIGHNIRREWKSRLSPRKNHNKKIAQFRVNQFAIFPSSSQIASRNES
jgi:hypothetical protein